MNQKYPYAHTPIRPHLFIGLFLVVLAFLACTVPANHTEAEDAYEYARRVEQESGQMLFHPHHLLYLPLAQGVYHLLQAAGYAGRALPVLIGISVLCGALSVSLFAAWLARKRGLAAALPFSLGLLFSYGFWRYACEAEIYTPALCVAVAVFWILHQPWTANRRILAVSLISAFGICIHVLNVIPLLGGVALFYWVSRKRRQAFAHVLLTSSLVALVYLAAANTTGLYVPPADTQPLEGGLSFAMFAKGSVGFAQAVVSGNFLFICPDFQQQIQTLFPYRMFAEEIYMGSRVSMGSFYAALGTSLLGAAGILLLLLDVVRRRFRDCWPVEWTASLAAALFWLVGLSGAVLLFEPGNPEMWVMALLPLWWCAALLLERLPRLLQRLLLVIALLLGLHNWVGGMALIQSRSGDYSVQKTRWLLSRATKDTLIVTAESHVYISYLNYWTDAEIMDLNYAGPSKKTLAKIREWHGPVYVLSEVFSPLPALVARFPDSKERLAQVADALRLNSVKVHEDEAGCIYQYSRQMPLPFQ